MAKGLSRAEQWAVRILCALALLLAGFTYKPPMAAASPLPAELLSEYVLPDGTSPVLCLPSEDGKSSHGSHDAGTGCEFCRLASAVLLPSPADSAGRPISRSINLFVPTRTETFYRQLFPPNTSPRGPPSGLSA
ncbi:hypothetical protein JVX98_31830 (plasmid) [Ensifer sp. PDNC004]|uniref:DUF2946 family protein n=1 Tax=unclassified Ensifer TaxID=2633371 RepID=UPI0017815DE3|nr:MULTISPECIES: DUF2946 family protein [unclassified Ensifer]MBD9650275.1 hypothetical protein [Ensifer sp. ENS09]QRY70623.1 hypothetical protein JVX98_31830 [Ensifer sp. PDNC004]